MEITSCFIRKNTPELRDRLKLIGIHPCVCCEFENWDWIHVSTDGVHGVDTALDEEFGGTQSDSLLKNKNESCSDCGEDEEMFLRLSKEIFESLGSPIWM